jgi:hypothetical protein
MERCAKLLTTARNTPRRVTARDFRRLAVCFGFRIDRTIRGHVIYARPHDKRVLVVTLRRRMAPVGGVRRLLDLIDLIDAVDGG